MKSISAATDAAMNDAAIDNPAAPKAAALSRRALFRGGSALALAAGATTLLDTNVYAQESAPHPAMRSPQVEQVVAALDGGAPEVPNVAVIALTRMAFGATPNDWAAFNALGNSDDERLTAYVDQQLNPAAIDDSVCDGVIASWGFTTLNKSLTKLWADHANGEMGYGLPAEEVEQATFLRAIYSKRQLVQVLADYWHNHFNIYAWDGWPQPTFVHYDRDVIRANLLGNFRTMLEAVAQSPAMLYYLDNQFNSGDKPNENYARECFELHVMGSENYFGVRSINDPAIKDENGKRLGYVDSDVYGATTCFTGWRIDEETGLFKYDDEDHFPYTKIVLGEVIPEFQGIKDGKQVLDMLAYHPKSAHYICRRLCRRFISDNPPDSVVQAAADVFVANQKAPDQLKKVMRTILLSPEFRATWGEKIKRPFEFSVSVMRALQANYGPEGFFWHYDDIGQSLFGWRPPNGYPDDRNAWSGTMPMLQRWRHVNRLFEWRIGGEGAHKDDYRVNPHVNVAYKTPNGLVDYYSNRLLGRALPSSERQPIVDFIASGRNPDFDLPDDQIEDRLRPLVALICMSPSFQWR